MFKCFYETYDKKVYRRRQLSITDMVGLLKMNTTLEYSTRVVQEGDRRCKKSTLNDLAYLTPLRIPLMNPVLESILLTTGGFIKGILRGVRCTKSLRVLFLHRRPPSWTTLVLYSRASSFSYSKRKSNFG